MKKTEIESAVREILAADTSSFEASEHYFSLLEEGVRLSETPAGWGAVARFVHTIFDVIRSEVSGK